MRKRICKLVCILLLLAIATTLFGCRKADKVSYNVSREADDFNVCRKITVINARTDKIVFQLEGVFSMSNSDENELTLICQTGENEYKKHFIYLNEWTLYFVEDLSGAQVSPYHYNVVFFPLGK